MNGEIVRRLALIDMPAESLRQVMQVLADALATDDDRRRRDRDRKRESRALSADSPQTVQGQSADCPPDCPENPPQEKNQPPKPRPSVEESVPRATAADQLAPVVGADLAAEIVQHRRGIKAALTVGAARRLAGELSKAEHPKAAAEFMIDKGWRGFKVEWMANARAGPPSRSGIVIPLNSEARPDAAHKTPNDFLRSIARQRAIDAKANDSELSSGRSAESGDAPPRLLSKG